MTGPVTRSQAWHGLVAGPKPAHGLGPGPAAGPPANAVTVNVAQLVVLACESGLIRPGWLAKGAMRRARCGQHGSALFMTHITLGHTGRPLDYRRVHKEKATLREAHGWAHAARRHATVALWFPAPRSCWPPPC
jgi:hypothetical protein